MGIIKELGNIINSVEHERLSIFCFTLIIIFSLIYWNKYSISVILLCFSLILYFFFISFYYYKTQYPSSKGKTITISEYKLPKKNETIHKSLKFIQITSWFLLLISLLSLIIIYFKELY